MARSGYRELRPKVHVSADFGRHCSSGLDDECVQHICEQVGFKYNSKTHSRRDWNGCAEVSARDQEGVHTEGVYIVHSVRPSELVRVYNQNHSRIRDEGRTIVSATREPREGYGAIHWKR